VITGKTAPYFLFVALDVVLVTALRIILFDIPFNGSVAVFTHTPAPLERAATAATTSCYRRGTRHARRLL
jgi:hypothetical protein